jgi:predicted ATPase
MDNKPKYISKIEIKGLWGKYDIDWDLNPDVNVLGGINGSGKSTLLRMVYSLASSKIKPNVFKSNSISILFSDKNTNSFIIKEDKFICQNTHYNPKITGAFPQKHKDAQISTPQIPNLLLDFVTTFDSELKTAEAIQALSNNEISTELDWQLHHLQKEYLNYQLNISKKLKEISKSQSPNMAVEMQNVQHAQERFLDIMDDLYRATDKKIDRDSNEIALFFGDTPLTPYQLSSGEKQILVILLTVLVQNNQSAVLIMDKPEISLHIDWQEKLIAYIRELNPNVQVIIATHSPGIIIDGWQDKVTEMSDIKHEILKISQ